MTSLSLTPSHAFIYLGMPLNELICDFSKVRLSTSCTSCGAYEVSKRRPSFGPSPVKTLIRWPEPSEPLKAHRKALNESSHYALERRHRKKEEDDTNTLSSSLERTIFK
jgi:hypothetical protein